MGYKPTIVDLLRLNREDTSRREFLKMVALVGGALVAPGVLEIACTPAQAPTSGGAPGAMTPKKGGVLVYGAEAEINPLYSDYGLTWSNGRVSRHIFEPLMESDILSSADVSPTVGVLAEKWTESPDAKVTTWTLRKGVKFHDGAPFNAEAVKYNIEREFDKSHPFYHAKAWGSQRQRFGFIDKVEVVDEYTVRMTQKQPYVNFVLLMRGYGVTSPEAIKKYGNDELHRYPLGTGPFKLEEFKAGDRVVMVKNKDYWGKEPWLDKIIFRPMGEPAVRVVSLKSGDIDFSVNLPPDTYADFGKDARFDVIQKAYGHVWFVRFNSKNPPFNDRRVRIAATMAVNKDALIRDILKNTGVKAIAPFGPGTDAYDPDLKEIYPYNPTKAKELLRDAGFPNGFETTVYFPPSGSGMMAGQPMVEFIQRNLAEVGIRVKMVPQEWNTYVQKYYEGLTPDVGLTNMSHGTDSGTNVSRLYHTRQQPPNGPNPGWYSNAEVDRVLDQADQEPDFEKRRSLWKQANRLIAEDAADIYVAHDTLPRVMNRKIHDYVAPAQGSFVFFNAWLDQ
ncbi:MAG: twin-arginine translocation signal domain-containing protein [Chloroflexi bacterium]|nr:twin-arginine translocation signal domain-containing protein [Chloroflexota bacterium]